MIYITTSTMWSCDINKWGDQNVTKVLCWWEVWPCETKWSCDKIVFGWQKKSYWNHYWWKVIAIFDLKHSLVIITSQILKIPTSSTQSTRPNSIQSISSILYFIRMYKDTLNNNYNTRSNSIIEPIPLLLFTFLYYLTRYCFFL